MRKLMGLLLGLIAGTPLFATAGEFATTVDMRSKGATTFVVESHIAGHGTVDFMVDTGSGYTTINEEILGKLQASGNVRYLRQLRGRLANGSEIDVPVYLIEAVSIGANCWLRDVEAAVFPGKTRPILGLNALQRTAPFIFSFEPPRLQLSHCAGHPTEAGTPRAADLAAFAAR